MASTRIIKIFNTKKMSIWNQDPNFIFRSILNDGSLKTCKSHVKEKMIYYFSTKGGAKNTGDGTKDTCEDPGKQKKTQNHNIKDDTTRGGQTSDPIDSRVKTMTSGNVTINNKKQYKSKSQSDTKVTQSRISSSTMSDARKMVPAAPNQTHSAHLSGPPSGIPPGNPPKGGSNSSSAPPPLPPGSGGDGRDGKPPGSSGFPPGRAPSGFGDDPKVKKRVLGQLSSLIESPYKVAGLHGGYAMALYAVAKRQHKLDKVEKDLIKLKEFYVKDSSFQNFIDHPEPSVKVRLDFLRSLSPLDLDVITINTLKTLIENYRLNKLLKIIEGYLEIYATHNRQVKLELVTARQLKPEQRDRLFAVLTKLFPSKTLHTTEKVDPQLLGGFIVTIGDIHVDMSARKVVKTYEALLSTKA